MDAEGKGEATDRAGTAVKIDRRRPGRPAHVSPELIPLLRGAAELRLPPPLPVRERRDDPPMLGIAAGVALSLPLWGVIGLIYWVAVA